MACTVINFQQQPTRFSESRSNPRFNITVKNTEAEGGTPFRFHVMRESLSQCHIKGHHQGEAQSKGQRAHI